MFPTKPSSYGSRMDCSDTYYDDDHVNKLVQIRRNSSVLAKALRLSLSTMTLSNIWFPSAIEAILNLMHVTVNNSTSRQRQNPPKGKQFGMFCYYLSNWTFISMG